MARPGWYNTNRNRAFPFLKGTVGVDDDGPLTLRGLPDEAVVDCGFLAGVDSGFTADGHRVRLVRLARSGADFTLEFEADAPGLYDHRLTFTRQVGDPEYAVEFSDEAPASVSASDGCGQPRWSGYLVTGRVSALELLLPGDGEVLAGPGEAVVEPALVHNLAGAFVGSLNLANDDRTRASAAEGCDELVWPHDTGLIFVNARCLQGGVLLKAGYNALVRQSAQNNAIVLGAAVGRGEGEPCAEVALFEDEQPPAGGLLLAGGPDCAETIRTINGVGGRLFNFLNTAGVTISPDPEGHSIRIDVSMAGLALCFDSVSVASESAAQ